MLFYYHKLLGFLEKTVVYESLDTTNPSSPSPPPPTRYATIMQL